MRKKQKRTIREQPLSMTRIMDACDNFQSRLFERNPELMKQIRQMKRKPDTGHSFANELFQMTDIYVIGW